MKRLLWIFVFIVGINISSNHLVAQWVQTKGPSGGKVIAFAVKGARIFVGTNGGGVFRSTNNGISWEAVNSGLTSDWIFSFAISGSALYTGTNGGGVSVSTNNGSSWSDVGWGLDYPYIISFTSIGTDVFAATLKGVFRWANNNTPWSAVNSGLTNTDVRAFAVLNSHLYVGTWGSGVWKRPLQELITSVRSGSDELPMFYSLSQNYPNPFNPRTIIRYSIPNDVRVTLKIFDILGSEVELLVSGHQTMGNYEVEFDAAKYASGTYFYRLQAGDYAETKKMILLK